MDVSRDQKFAREILGSSSYKSDAATTTTARAYYNSHDADTFYRTIWGGSTINIGLFESPSDPIPTASYRTIERMASLLTPLTSATRVLDLGSGYGGAARYLARTYGCTVCCLNLSEVENERNRRLIQEEGLESLVTVREGSFEDLCSLPEGGFDVVWSQDAFLHSGDRRAMVREIDRVLVRKGASVIFTDPMAAEGVDQKELGSVLRRLHLESLGDVEAYRRWFGEVGFMDVGFVDLTRDMEVHYGMILRELECRERELKTQISDEYLANMKVGLRKWVEGARSGRLSWGILQFRR
ncbi:hypothetical protein IMSHALPRED_009443 [Imshaugia aleurites]|uniref:Methyltransferase type 11 domain-containing protein n=1 Tax=Imshaugia aleurites TaxID=172621 RepID=A0A8H3IU48_9LECA|nr:hypothetical protein IMSHALPRED_009443 [Imshaugia aleurites]